MNKKLTTQISIHAPVKGATSFRLLENGLGWNFNPRPREGSDNIIFRVSFFYINFNPRPREGSDEEDPRLNK